MSTDCSARYTESHASAGSNCQPVVASTRTTQYSSTTCLLHSEFVKEAFCRVAVRRAWLAYVKHWGSSKPTAKPDQALVVCLQRGGTRDHSGPGVGGGLRPGGAR